MGLFKGLIKVGLSPLRGVKQIVDDFKEDDGGVSAGLSILTLGVSSVVKGTAKGLKEGVEDIFED
jgi:hypothetical protein